MKKIINHHSLGEITLSRTRRARRITLTVRPTGEIRVSLPVFCSIRSGMAFLEEKRQWIESTRTRMAEKNPIRVLSDGYKTTRRVLKFIPADILKIQSRVGESIITVKYPFGLSTEDPEVQEEGRKAVIRALRSEANEYLPQLTANLAARHGFRYRSITIRQTVSRWGSCSGNDDISLSLYLMRLPEHLREYIILHELCHTIHKDHSHKFHSLLDSVLGGLERQYIKEMKGYRADIF